MTRIVLNVSDERKVDMLLSLLGDLDYVDVHAEITEKVWNGYLPVFDNPVYIPGFKMFSREELHER